MIPTKDQAAQLAIVLRRQSEGCHWLVLWVTPVGMKYWSGPYLTEDEANTATAVRDGHQLSMIVRLDAGMVTFTDVTYPYPDN
jgi:hypothetical protein